MTAALYGEWLKLRRSRLPWITLAACTLGTVVGGLFMYISLHPDRARDLGLLGAKAQLATVAPDWNGFLGFLAQIIAVGGVLIYGIVTVWMFGREFADHTAKDLLALPTSRTAIVGAKFTIAATWCLLLTVYIAALGLAVGAGLGLPASSPAVFGQGLARLAITALLTIALTTAFGVAASIGRGYLPGVAALLAASFTAQIIAALGYGAWYPYSVAPLYAGLAGPDQQQQTWFGFATIIAVALASITASIRWWKRTDHTR